MWGGCVPVTKKNVLVGCDAENRRQRSCGLAVFFLSPVHCRLFSTVFCGERIPSEYSAGNVN